MVVTQADRLNTSSLHPSLHLSPSLSSTPALHLSVHSSLPQATSNLPSLPGATAQCLTSPTSHSSTPIRHSPLHLSLCDSTFYSTCPYSPPSLSSRPTKLLSLFNPSSISLHFLHFLHHTHHSTHSLLYFGFI